MPSRTATFILIALALVAVIGFGQGLSHAFTAPRPEEALQSVGDPARDPVPLAKAMTGPVLDEARVRQIAREEADAALARSRPKKAAPKEEDVDDRDAAAPMSAAPKPVEPAPASAPSTPPASPTPQ